MNIKQMAVAVLAASAVFSAAAETELVGAGGSFPAPLYQKWAYAYSAKTPGVKVNYQSVGSSAGIRQIKAATVDWAGTDAPVAEDDLKVSGLKQFHMVSGAVVAACNLPGVESLTLDGATLARIYLGEIKRWNDPAIAALNPGASLPDLKITVVRRGDGSGTTHIFSTYLSSVSAEWKEKVGAGTQLKWPCGIAGQKNPGVCNLVARIRGAIGYTEYTFAIEAKLAVAKMSVGGAKVSPDEPSWPMLGKTYVLVRDDLDAAKRTELEKFFAWCRREGGETAKAMHYIPVAE